MLPLDAALELREKLIEYAANTKDHTLSDTFVQLFNLRLPQQWTQDGTLKQLLRRQEQKTKYLDLVTQFLELVDAKIKRENSQHLTIETIEGSLSPYAPLPVLLTVDTPTDKDVIRLVEISEKLANANLTPPTPLPYVRAASRREGRGENLSPLLAGEGLGERSRVGILFYKVSPDTTARMETAKVRLRDHFVLIPIPLAQVEQALPNQDECRGLLEVYCDRYLQRADFFDDRNAISDTFSFFGRTELLQRLAEKLLRFH